MKPSLYLLLPLAFPVQAQNVSELPGSLFDIELGGVYEYGSPGVDEGSVGTFPVRRLISEQVSLNRGLSRYFEPLSRNGTFPFNEFTLDNGELISSFRFYILPVLPEVTGTLAELQERDLPQQVLMIEWSQGSRIADGDNYSWAYDLCTSLAVEFGIEPEVTDNVENGVYRCVFSSGDREMEVTSVLGRTVQLSLSDEITDQMESDVYGTIRRLELEERREEIRRRRQELRSVAR